MKVLERVCVLGISGRKSNGKERTEELLRVVSQTRSSLFSNNGSKSLSEFDSMLKSLDSFFFFQSVNSFLGQNFNGY